MTLAKKFKQTKLGKFHHPRQNEEGQKNQTKCYSSSKTSTHGFARKQVMSSKTRPYISIKTKREVFLKAQNCCEYLDKQSGRKCTSTFQLEIDHIKPIALNGTSHISNLRILCRNHNQWFAQNSGLIF